MYWRKRHYFIFKSNIYFSSDACFFNASSHNRLYIKFRYSTQCDFYTINHIRHLQNRSGQLPTKIYQTHFYIALISIILFTITRIYGFNSFSSIFPHLYTSFLEEEKCTVTEDFYTVLWLYTVTEIVVRSANLGNINVCFPLLYTSSCSILAFLKLKSEYDI